jgi:hypothetical protein
LHGDNVLYNFCDPFSLISSSTVTTAIEPTKVIVSSAIEPSEREILERMARDGYRTLSQEIRLAIREHLERQEADER